MYSNIDVLRFWCIDVASGKEPRQNACTAVDNREMLELSDCAIQSVSWMYKKGAPARVSARGDILKNGFKMTANGHSFIVYPPAAPTKKGVAETSRMAYKEVALGEQQIAVAKAVIDLHLRHEWVSDRLVADTMRPMPASQVSARRNEIERMGVVSIDGVRYVFTQSEEKIKCPVTGKTVNGWALRKKESAVLTLF